MDYQVFLVSRIYEEWHRTVDNQLAVTRGLAATGRTITAAAAIMILVFGAFILGGERVIMLFGLGLAGAVLLDALVIRMALVPGLMLLVGKANWWLTVPSRTSTSRATSTTVRTPTTGSEPPATRRSADLRLPMGPPEPTVQAAGP